MREIRFRVWSNLRKEMIVNPPLKYNYGKWILNFADIIMEDIVLLQFTGIKDKNGKEVYEGDVVHLKDISGSGSERNFGLKEIKWGDVGFPESLLTEDIKVMGNIYQNPATN